MEQADTLLGRLQDVFRETFHDDEITISPATSAADIEDWDSLMHVTLVLNVEREFGVRFKSGEVAALENVGELIDLVRERL